MKLRNCILFSATFLAAAVWATSAFGQANPGQGNGTGSGTRPPGQEKRNEKVDKELGPSDRALERALQNLDRLPKGLQKDLATLQASLESIRAAWQNGYDPGEGATEEELEAAREQFEQDMAEEIEANRDLRKKVVTSLRDDLRTQAKGRELTEQERTTVADYEQVRQQLEARWREARAELGPNPSNQEIRAAKEVFMEENAELINQQNELAGQVRDLLKEAQGGSPAAARGQLPEALRTMRAQIQVQREALRDQKRRMRDELKGLSPEEREQRREEILEELRNAHNEMKERRRRLIEDLRDEQDGDRRAED